jgi:hypothetical protein
MEWRTRGSSAVAYAGGIDFYTQCAVVPLCARAHAY